MHPLKYVPILPENSFDKFDSLLIIPTSAWVENKQYANFDIFFMNDKKIEYKREGLHGYRIETKENDNLIVDIDYFLVEDLYLPRITCKKHQFRLKSKFESYELLDFILIKNV